jgi:hypothetical protein
VQVDLTPGQRHNFVDMLPAGRPAWRRGSVELRDPPGADRRCLKPTNLSRERPVAGLSFFAAPAISSGLALLRRSTAMPSDSGSPLKSSPKSVDRRRLAMGIC